MVCLAGCLREEARPPSQTANHALAHTPSESKSNDRWRWSSNRAPPSHLSRADVGVIPPSCGEENCAHVGPHGSRLWAACACNLSHTSASGTLCRPCRALRHTNYTAGFLTKETYRSDRRRVQGMACRRAYGVLLAVCGWPPQRYHHERLRRRWSRERGRAILVYIYEALRSVIHFGGGELGFNDRPLCLGSNEERANLHHHFYVGSGAHRAMGGVFDAVDAQLSELSGVCSPMTQRCDSVVHSCRRSVRETVSRCTSCPSCSCSSASQLLQQLVGRRRN